MVTKKTNSKRGGFKDPNTGDVASEPLDDPCPDIIADELVEDFDLPDNLTEEQLAAELKKIPRPKGDKAGLTIDDIRKLDRAPKGEIWFPGLTTAQNIFLREWLSNGRQVVPAHRAAYDNKLNDCARRVAGYRLLSTPTIRAALAEIQKRATAALSITLKSHLEELALLRDMAKSAGQFSAAIAAEVARGKAGGLYVDRSIVTTKAVAPSAPPTVTAEEFAAIAMVVNGDI